MKNKNISKLFLGNSLLFFVPTITISCNNLTSAEIKKNFELDFSLFTSFSGNEEFNLVANKLNDLKNIANTSKQTFLEKARIFYSKYNNQIEEIENKLLDQQIEYLEILCSISNKNLKIFLRNLIKICTQNPEYEIREKWLNINKYLKSNLKIIKPNFENLKRYLEQNNNEPNNIKAKIKDFDKLQNNYFKYLNYYSPKYLEDFKYNFSDFLKANKATYVKLDKIIDGDTISVYLKNDKFKIRFAGIDTPEIRKANNTYEQNKNINDIQNKHGLIAKKYIEKILTNANKIILVPQVNAYKNNNSIKDKYNRIISIIYFLDKNNYLANLNLEIIKNGYGIMKYISIDADNIYFTKNEEYYNKLVEASIYAKNNNLGVYKNKDEYSFIYPKK
ncbi:hypothetical protein FJO69_00475 [[Mycoplasma] falconis]|uniref:TNase-like domain-containing protein n=1 Tax=[Mycoplasma] falconis TaxID=92403 RepID=A0A501XCA0_9BACT|nr:thermonuclease family protein [[Mycoplasma] falconis]TPE58069.1 hypothetical protein FJO69_00475 [[Mycoplasma] falconis]